MKEEEKKSEGVRKRIGSAKRNREWEKNRECKRKSGVEKESGVKKRIGSGKRDRELKKDSGVEKESGVRKESGVGVGSPGIGTWYIRVSGQMYQESGYRDRVSGLAAGVGSREWQRDSGSRSGSRESGYRDMVRPGLGTDVSKIRVSGQSIGTRSGSRDS